MPHRTLEGLRIVQPGQGFRTGALIFSLAAPTIFGKRRANFYEKALFVKPTWRSLSVAECNCSVCALLALCFYPHFQ